MTPLSPSAVPAGPRTAMPTPEATDFAALGLSPDIVAALEARGIRTPFPVQTLTIPDALAGRDICGKARTGSGKTLAFGLPLIERVPASAPRRPRALVLVPTRELASQVVRELAPIAAGRRVRIAALYGGASLNRQADTLRAGLEIIVATPGRLADLLDRGALTLAEVAYVVIDEADQMADMGFLPQVTGILNRIERQHQTLLFSATLDGAVDQLVRRYQHEPLYREVPTEAGDEPAMTHRFVGVSDEQRVAVAAEIAAGPTRTLMFVRTQRGADRLARQLAREGVSAGVIHGRLSQPQRERALSAFATGSAGVLVATNVAARGIHVDGVDIVLHHDPPEDVKTYLHRSGRTARAGASGLVVTLVSPEQLREVNALRREAGVREAVVAMAPGDARLADLAGWEPPLEDHTPRAQSGRASAAGDQWRRGGGGRDRRPSDRPQRTGAENGTGNGGQPARRPVRRWRSGGGGAR